MEEVESGEGVAVSEFGGEGTGLKSMLDFDWREGKPVTFTVTGQRSLDKDSWLCRCRFEYEGTTRFMAAFRRRSRCEIFVNFYFQLFSQLPLQLLLLVLLLLVLFPAVCHVAAAAIVLCAVAASVFSIENLSPITAPGGILVSKPPSLSLFSASTLSTTETSTPSWRTGTDALAPRDTSRGGGPSSPPRL